MIYDIRTVKKTINEVEKRACDINQADDGGTFFKRAWESVMKDILGVHMDAVIREYMSINRMRTAYRKMQSKADAKIVKKMLFSQMMDGIGKIEDTVLFMSRRNRNSSYNKNYVQECCKQLRIILRTIEKDCVECRIKK